MSGQTLQLTTGKVENEQPFSFKTPFYDLNTYAGRFKSIWSSTNPLLFWLSDKQVLEAKNSLDDCKNQEMKANAKGEVYMLTTSEIEKMRRNDSIVRSSIHPDTGKLIPKPMRFSAYLYANIPINFGFLLSAPTTMNIVLWQWINQTYYVGVNYSNRNASSKFTNKDLWIGYSLAVFASIGMGLGVKKFIQPFKSSFTGSKAFFFMFAISFVANSAANGTNLMIIRSKEFREGIPVITKDGEEVGISKKCGRSAVLQTAMTRCIMPILPLGLPTLSFFLLAKMSMIPKTKVLRIVQQTIVFSYSLMCAPAMGLAWFPLIVKKSSTELEPEFHNLKDKEGNVITELFYNKGM
jgi:hypothetical protein